MEFFNSTIYFIITIGILVFIHEFGHFIAAKICKMRTEVFAIGFGKRLIGWNKINGFTFGNLPAEIDMQGHTDYRISLLPLGGYVKISGMVDESMDKSFVNKEPQPYEFRSKSTIQKLFVITAGVMMNLTLTLVVFAGINFFQGKQVFMTTTLGEVQKDSFAEEAGFQSGDKILEINEVEVDNWEQTINLLLLDKMGVDKNIKIERGGEIVAFSIDGKLLTDASQQKQIFLPLGETLPMVSEVFEDSPAGDAGIAKFDIFLSIDYQKLYSSAKAIEIISSNKNKEIPLVILRGEDTVKTSVIPGIDGKIGIRIGDAYTGIVEFETYGFFESISLGIEDIILYTNLTFSSLGSVIRGDIEFGSAFGGPVRIAQFAAHSADLGIVPFLRFIAMLSLTLAIINIMPFPVLDGGHFVVILIEGIIKRELPIKLKIAIQNFGFIILLILMAFILYNDILHL